MKTLKPLRSVAGPNGCRFIHRHAAFPIIPFTPTVSAFTGLPAGKCGVLVRLERGLPADAPDGDFC